MSEKDRIAQLERELAETRARLDAADPRPKQPEPTHVDTILRLALDKANGDPEAAADLFWAWVQHSSEIRESLKPLIREAIEARLDKVSQ